MVTCNGAPVLVLAMSMPLLGAWVYDVELASEADLAGAVTLVDDDQTFSGTKLRSGVFGGRTKARVVGGSGKLRVPLPARSYLGSTAHAVVTDLLTAAGMQLEASNALLQRVLPYWTRSAGSAGKGLSAVADAIGASWRVLANGRVWFGADAYPVQKVTATELERDDALGLSLIAPEKMDLRPGVTYLGRKVSRVEHRIADGDLRTTVWAA